MLHIMKRLTTTLVLALSVGCAHQPTVAEHLRAGEISLKGAAVRHSQDVRDWESKVDARIAFCRAANLKTEDERARCMGALGDGDKFEPDAEALAEAYDQIAEQLEVAKSAARRLEELYESAAKEAHTDED